MPCGAQLQIKRPTSPLPRLLRIDSRAGPGPGKLIDEYADSYAFAAHYTGLNIREEP